MELLTESMPIDYLEMAYLAIDDTGITEGQKIDKMDEILGKLQTCGILAVNQLESKDSNFKRSKANNVRQLPAVSTNLNPLGIPLCPVDVRHKCHRSPKCEPNWGLLVCVELYKLRTVEERISYCKTSKCCQYLSGSELSDLRHKRCDYKNPVVSKGQSSQEHAFLEQKLHLILMLQVIFSCENKISNKL